MIWDLITTPDDHADAYVWAAVLLAHALIGAASFLAGVLLTRRERATAILAVALWTVWEGTQAAFFGGGIADGLTDLAANIFGVCLAWALWQRRAALAAVAVAFLSVAAWRRMRCKR